MLHADRLVLNDDVRPKRLAQNPRSDERAQNIDDATRRVIERRLNLVVPDFPGQSHADALDSITSDVTRLEVPDLRERNVAKLRLARLDLAERLKSGRERRLRTRVELGEVAVEDGGGRVSPMKRDGELFGRDRDFSLVDDAVAQGRDDYGVVV